MFIPDFSSQEAGVTRILVIPWLVVDVVTPLRRLVCSEETTIAESPLNKLHACFDTISNPINSVQCSWAMSRQLKFDGYQERFSKTSTSVCLIKSNSLQNLRHTCIAKESIEAYPVHVSNAILKSVLHDRPVQPNEP